MTTVTFVYLQQCDKHCIDRVQKNLVGTFNCRCFPLRCKSNTIYAVTCCCLKYIQITFYILMILQTGLQAIMPCPWTMRYNLTAQLYIK